jgi:cell division transport system permease protein
MQLFGATKSFIQRPFLQSAIWVGLLAGILAPFLLQGLIYLVEKEFPELTQLRSESELIIIFLILLVTGIILSFASTFFAVNRYLRRKIDELY